MSTTFSNLPSAVLVRPASERVVVGRVDVHTTPAHLCCTHTRAGHDEEMGACVHLFSGNKRAGPHGIHTRASTQASTVTPPTRMCVCTESAHLLVELHLVLPLHLHGVVCAVVVVVRVPARVPAVRPICSAGADGRADGRTDGSGQTDGRTDQDGRTDGRTGGRTTA